MNVRPFELTTAAGATAAAGPQPADAEARPEMRAAPAADEDAQRPEEPPDEPGYGHGV